MRKSILFSEVLWLLISIILITIIVLPIYWHNVDFQYWALLIGSFMILIYFLRLIFLLKFTFIKDNIWIQAIIILSCLPLFFIVYNSMHGFQAHLDHGDLNNILDGYGLDTRRFLYNYIRNAVLFGAIGAILTILILPFRMLISIWKLFKNNNYKGRRL